MATSCRNLGSLSAQRGNRFFEGIRKSPPPQKGDPLFFLSSLCSASLLLAVIALSAEGAVEATAAVDGYHGKRLAVATERSDVTRPVVAGGGTTRKEARIRVRARVDPRQKPEPREATHCKGTTLQTRDMSHQQIWVMTSVPVGPRWAWIRRPAPVRVP